MTARLHLLTHNALDSGDDDANGPSTAAAPPVLEFGHSVPLEDLRHLSEKTKRAAGSLGQNKIAVIV